LSASAIEDGRVGGAGFLADYPSFGQDRGQPLGQPDLAFLVGDGDEVVRRFLANLFRRQILVAGHDDVAPHLPHQRDDGIV
jgi:hypothetical protein